MAPMASRSPLGLRTAASMSALPWGHPIGRVQQPLRSPGAKVGREYDTGEAVVLVHLGRRAPGRVLAAVPIGRVHRDGQAVQGAVW